MQLDAWVKLRLEHCMPGSRGLLGMVVAATADILGSFAVS